MNFIPGQSSRLSTIGRRGAIGIVALVTIVAMALIAVGGYWLYNNSQIGKGDFKPITAIVEEGDFISQVLDQGEIQSSENIEIRCRARARNGELKVIEVVPEGTRVKPGDFLVRLDATVFETELEEQKLQRATAQTAQIQSEAALAGAEASLREYTDGIYVEAEKTIENEIFDAKAGISMARQELDQSKAVLEHSIKLHEKGFIPTQTRDADAFAVDRAKTNLDKAQNSLELAETKMVVLKDITREKELIQLRSDIAAAKVKRDNDLEALKIEEQKLVEIQQQIDNCIITVPPKVEGQVVYAKESSRSGTEWMLEEGTTVRENQVLLRLPNPNKMEVKALINEQSITQIRSGMPAYINVDALNSQSLKGFVTRVSQYAESSDWRSASNVRKYAVLVQITDPPEVLKPGMNSSVTIQSRHEKGVLVLPVQCVYGVQDQYFCLARSPGGEWETRLVETGGDNSKLVIIRSGLKKGEEVVMNPGAYKHMMDLPEVSGEEPMSFSESEQAAIGQTSQEGEGAKNQNGPPQGAAGEGRGPTEPGAGPGGGGPGAGFDMAAMINQRVKDADTNGDGKLEASEMENLDERMRGMLGQADKNGDGKISKDEIEASIKAVEQMMKSRGGGGEGGGRGPGGGQGGGDRGGRGQ